MYQLDSQRQPQLVALAMAFFQRPLPYRFSQTEQKALRSFFTSLVGHVFCFHNVPSNVLASTIARYSRLKNVRGIRGIWVDEILPHLLATQSQWVSERSDMDTGTDYASQFLKENKIKSLDDFVAFSPETELLFEEFLSKSAADPDYLQHFVDSKRARRLLSLFMDSFGHNSIARGAFVALCCENISIHAAKSLEWTRPANGIIELSTRYVSMQKALLYPIWDELALYGVDPAKIQGYYNACFGEYRGLVGDEKSLDGPLPSYFREHYRDLITDERDLERGITGETFDLCGNLLPTAACTSVALVCSGEAFPTILKHLILDGTPENLALVELIAQESAKIGGDQFARHYLPTEADRRSWSYLSVGHFLDSAQRLKAPWASIIDEQPEAAPYVILDHFAMKEEFRGCENMADIAAKLFYQFDKDGNVVYQLNPETGQEEPVSIRATYDKLPSEFEAFTVSFEGVMSWRGWRDLHRMSFAAHNRTLVMPYLGFYQYDKPAPAELAAAFNRVETAGRELYEEAQRCGVPEFMLQYLLPMGFNIGYSFIANLREHEFCGFQRTKYDVNHEVRQSFLAHENALRVELPWWSLFSRANTTPAYVFARASGPDGTGVPLPEMAAL